MISIDLCEVKSQRFSLCMISKIVISQRDLSPTDKLGFESQPQVCSTQEQGSGLEPATAGSRGPSRPRWTLEEGSLWLMTSLARTGASTRCPACRKSPADVSGLEPAYIARVTSIVHFGSTVPTYPLHKQREMMTLRSTARILVPNLYA